MKQDLERMSIESLTEGLIQETVDINAVNLAFRNHRTAFVDAIKKRPNLLTKIKEVNVPHFFAFAIKENYKYFLYLKKELYTEELAQLYLEERFKADENRNREIAKENKTYKVATYKSMDNKMVFAYSYLTPEDDELYYFDQELQVPLSLKSSIKVVLKLTSVLDLIKELDINIANLGQNTVNQLLADKVNNQYKSFLYTYLQEKKTGYYSLCASVEPFETAFASVLNKTTKKYGFEVKEFCIKKLAVPKDIRLKIEDQAFQLRQRKADMEMETELAKKSLESYEEKLSIQQKYPSAIHSLTEYEKDLALKRYLIKQGRWVEEDADHTVKLSQKIEKADEAIEKEIDIVPEIPFKKNTFKSSFITGLVMCVIVSLLVMIASAGVGLILLGLSIGLFGTIAALNYKKFADVKIEPATQLTEEKPSQEKEENVE